MLIGASLGALLVEHGNLRIFFPEFLGCSGPFQNTRKNTVTQLVTFFFDLNHHLSAVEIFSVGFLTFFQPENIFHPILGSSENLSSSKMPIGKGICQLPGGQILSR